MPSPAAPATAVADLPVRCLIGLLEAQGQWLAQLEPADYTRGPRLDCDSIGRHLRHSLEHVRALVCAISDGCAAYDRRARDARIETDRDLAVAQLLQLAAALAPLAETDLDTPVDVEFILDPAYPPSLQRSTFGRELSFVLSHAIHHNVIIGLVAQEFGYSMPRALMTAPATLAADAS